MNKVQELGVLLGVTDALFGSDSLYQYMKMVCPKRNSKNYEGPASAPYKVSKKKNKVVENKEKVKVNLKNRKINKRK